MPYIKQSKRNRLDVHIAALHNELVGLQLDDETNNHEGNLNYCITRLLRLCYGDKNTTSYSQINDAMGVLLCVALEHYRTVASPVENQKIYENGDVEIENLSKYAEITGDES